MNKRKLAIISLCVVVCFILAVSAVELGKRLKRESAPVAQVGREVEPGGTILFEKPMNESRDRRWITVAENEHLLMRIDEANGLVHVENKKSGNVWYSHPQNLEGIPSHQLNLMSNPFLIRFTQGGGTTSTFPQKEAGTLKALQLQSGVRAEYFFETLEMQITIDYLLTEDGMEVSIPYRLFEERGKSKLVTVELLPYFDGARATEQGYLVVPDGSGALIRFKESHITYHDRYSQFVYGPDYAFKKNYIDKIRKNPKENVYFNPREYIALPVFGMKRADQGFAAMITQGEHNARITSAPSGYQNMDVYRTAVEFLYRNDDLVHIGDSGEVAIFQGGITPGDRAVRYVLLEEEDASYVGIAHAYRNYLMTTKGVKPVQDQTAELQVRLIGGILREEILGKSFVRMTSFEQAQQIIDEFLQRGMRYLSITYEGWSKGGALGSQPKQFPVESRLGGMNGLKELGVYAQESDVSMYLSANYVMPYVRNSPSAPSKAASRGLDREVAYLYEPNKATLQPRLRQRYFLMKPDLALQEYLAKDQKTYADLPISGVRLDHIGDTLYSDQDSKHIYYRSQTMETWQSALELVRSHAGRAVVDYGFAYTLGRVDRIDDIPIDSSHYIYEDETVPFMQIALHGLIPYTASPVNLADDPRDYFLRTIEYGAIPSFLLTYEDSSNFKRTQFDHIFSSSYRDWLDTAAAVYEESMEVLQLVAGQTITGHEQVRKNVYRTTYDHGVSIVVNYNDEAVQVDGLSIGARSFAVGNGGRP